MEGHGHGFDSRPRRPIFRGLSFLNGLTQLQADYIVSVIFHGRQCQSILQLAPAGTVYLFELICHLSKVLDRAHVYLL